MTTENSYFTGTMTGTFQSTPITSDNLSTEPIVYHSCKLRTVWKEMRGSLKTSKYLLEVKGINKDSQVLEIRILSIYDPDFVEKLNRLFNLREIKSFKTWSIQDEDITFTRENYFGQCGVLVHRPSGDVAEEYIFDIYYCDMFTNLIR